MKRIVLTVVAAITFGGFGFGQVTTNQGHYLIKDNSNGTQDKGHLIQWNRLSLGLWNKGNSFTVEDFSDWTQETGAFKTLLRIVQKGNVGIGVYDPNYKLDIGGLAPYDGIRLDSKLLIRKSVEGSNHMVMENITENGSLYVRSQNGHVILNDTNNSKNVGIGTISPDEKLTVKGKIHAEEVRVDLSVPADYVFEKYYTGKSELKADYVMPTLEEVETFTKANNHLPNIPSAKEIQEEGLHLKEMTNLLLQKIEELTLYTIEQQKQLEKQARQLEVQQKEIQALKEK